MRSIADHVGRVRDQPNNAAILCRSSPPVTVGTLRLDRKQIGQPKQRDIIARSRHAFEIVRVSRAAE